MIYFAFKIAARAGSAWSLLIAKESGSMYSHVEVWLDGPRENARCFSSREPHGAGFQQINLTDAMWDIFPVFFTPEQESMVNGYCLGCDGKIYDGLGLIGYQFKNASIHDFHAVFCSEVGAAILQKCGGRSMKTVPWQTSPGDLANFVKSDPLNNVVYNLSPKVQS
jgi:hypothetical protein